MRLASTLMSPSVRLYMTHSDFCHPMAGCTCSAYTEQRADMGDMSMVVKVGFDQMELTWRIVIEMVPKMNFSLFFYGMYWVQNILI